MASKANNETNTITDNDVIDLITRVLYSDTSREFAFEEDILQKTKLKYTPADISRVWELLLASNMVDPSVGFGKAGKIELSSTGLMIMNHYGNYLNYLHENLQPKNHPTINSVMPVTQPPVTKSRKIISKKTKK